jgi:thiol-disulfide isomerase/thioredoxin
MTTAVTEQSFDEEVVQSDKPVIVDFWAEWCGPCHAVAPVLDRIVEERNGDLKLVKVNIDEQPALSQRSGLSRSRRSRRLSGSPTPRANSLRLVPFRRAGWARPPVPQARGPG